MDTGPFDRLSRLVGMPGTRRAALGALLGTAVLGAAPGSARAKRKRRSHAVGAQGKGKGKGKGKHGNHCISPSGADLNELFGISTQIVTTFCAEVGAGERWTVGQQVWVMPQSFEAVPNGFVPAGATPLADFLAKFEAVKYVVDPGTKHEKTVVVPTSGALFVVDAEDGEDRVSPTPLAALTPLPVGRHVVEAYWVFAAMHCDGLGTDPALQCFPAGETLFHRVEFEVTPGHR